MKNKKVIKYNDKEYRIGETVYFKDTGFAKIEKISYLDVFMEDTVVLDIHCIYDISGKPIDTTHTVTINCIEKATPILRKRINNLMDEEERLQNILSQCQKEV